MRSDFWPSSLCSLLFTPDDYKPRDHLRVRINLRHQTLPCPKLRKSGPTRTFLPHKAVSQVPLRFILPRAVWRHLQMAQPFSDRTPVKSFILARLSKLNFRLNQTLSLSRPSESFPGWVSPTRIARGHRTTSPSRFPIRRYPEAAAH